MKHLKEFVKSVPDYRRTDKGNYKHKLEDILLLVILGRLGKCITRPDIIRFGERNLKRFRSLGILLEGVPSEPTLCRVFKHIDDEAMSGRMSEFTAAFHAELVGFRGNDLITDREKWNGDLTVVEIRTATERKSDGQKSSERRFYVSSFHGSARRLGTISRMHWAIESMHWDLDRNLRQDFIRRKDARSARNLDTIQRMVLAILSIWKGKRKKLSDKAKGTAELIGELSMNFTAIIHMLAQK